MSFRKTILSFLLFGGTVLSLLAGGHDNLCVQTHFGHHGWDPLKNLKLVKELGVGWIRDDLYWGSVEKEKGNYKIPDYAWEWIKEAKKNDLKIILILNGGNRLYKDEYDHDGYVNFARFVAKEMKGYVQAIELINEPFNNFRRAAAKLSDTPTAWNGYDPKTGKINEWALKYLRTMNDMADAINEVAPGEYKILGLGCSPPLNTRLLKQGVSKHIDGMVIHPYSYRLVPELQPYGDTPAFLKRDGVVVGDKAGTFTSINKELMKTSSQNNGPKELWATELGYTTYIQTQPQVQNYGGFTEDAQAKYAQRHLMECLGTNMRLVSWYTFYHRRNSAYHKLAGFGILNYDGTPKPAYNAIQRVAKTMKGWKADKWGDIKVYFQKHRQDPNPVTWDGSLRQTFGEPRAYMFSSNNGKRRAAAIWSTERANSDLQPRSATVIINSDRGLKSITALDMMTGKEENVKFTQKGNLVKIADITVPDHPVMLYLEGSDPVTGQAITDTDIFNSAKNWKLHKARSIKASFSIDNNSVRLNFNGKGYAGISKKLTIQEGVSQLTFQARSTNKITLLLRVIDSTGQTHQYKLSAVPSNQWENFWVDLKNKHQNWGGAKDKKLHYPLTAVLFGLECSSIQQGAIDYKAFQLVNMGNQ